MRLPILIFVLLLAVGCESMSGGDIACDVGDIRISASFEGARLSDCERRSDTAFVIEISPETTPINPSPWFAFDIHSATAATAEIELRYTYGWHRYRPKVQFDNGAWETIEDVNLARKGKRAKFSLSLKPGTTRVSAQETTGLGDALELAERIKTVPDVTVSVGGKSVEQRDLLMIANAPGEDQAPLIVIVGRQHPPETVGSIGLYAFLDRLFDDDEMAQAFRRQFKLVIFPLLNPDGVAAGNWRSNANNVDINRDWGPFEQPETRAVRDAILVEQEKGAVPLLLLDFHGTKSDVFYTPDREDELTPKNFPTRWLSRMDAISCDRIPDPKPGWNPDLPTAKSWFPVAYGAPAITVEFGDESDRDYIRRISEAAAEALMLEFLSPDAPLTTETGEC